MMNCDNIPTLQTIVDTGTNAEVFNEVVTSSATETTKTDSTGRKHVTLAGIEAFATNGYKGEWTPSTVVEIGGIYGYQGLEWRSLTGVSGVAPVEGDDWRDLSSAGTAALQVKYDNNPSIVDTGGVGDGVTSDQSAFNAIIATEQALIDLPKGRYLVTSTDNPLGKELFGSGHLVKTATGGLEAQNTYADHYQRVTGQEYLAAWYRKMYDQHSAPTRPLKIVFSGDSTTAGVGVTSGFLINELVEEGVIKRGLQAPYGLQTINRGQSGKSALDWATNFVDTEIADNADLYVIRWGINDAANLRDGTEPPIDAGQNYPNRLLPSDFADRLRLGLTKLRSALPFETTSILLMMPNSTYDIPNARDALWYEQLRNIYVQAARDFNCAFIDTYAYMQDSRKLFNILMDDPMPTSGRGIHPNNTMNTIISGYICDLIAPEGMRYALGRNNVSSISGVESTPPSSYIPSSAIEHGRALGAGYPINGAVTTFKTADNILLQFHYGYRDTDRGNLKVRFGRAVELDGEPAGWSSFYDLNGATGTVGLAVAESGYSLPVTGRARAVKNGSIVVCDGYIIKDSPGSVGVPAGTTIATIPDGFRPTSEPAYFGAVVWDGASTFKTVEMKVETTGAVTFVSPTPIVMSRAWLSVSFSTLA